MNIETTLNNATNQFRYVAHARIASHADTGDTAAKHLDITPRGIKVETPEGLGTGLLFQPFQMVGAYQVAERRQLALNAIRYKVAKGHHIGNVPFGYMVEVTADGRRTLVPEAVDAPTVRRAYDLYIETGSERSVNEFLAAETGRPRTMSQTRRLLSDPAYTGAQVVGQARNDHSHPALIERDTWDRAQQIRAAHIHMGPKRVPAAKKV